MAEYNISSENVQAAQNSKRNAAGNTSEGSRLRLIYVGGLESKAHPLFNHSTLGSRVMKQQPEEGSTSRASAGPLDSRYLRVQCLIARPTIPHLRHRHETHQKHIRGTSKIHHTEPHQKHTRNASRNRGLRSKCVTNFRCVPERLFGDFLMCCRKLLPSENRTIRTITETLALKLAHAKFQIVS